MKRQYVWNFLCVVGMALCLLANPGAVGAAPDQTHRFDTDTLSVRNLIGQVRVESHRGSGFEVEVHVAGRDASDGMIQVQATDGRLDVRFPGGHSEFVYPELGNSSSSISARDDRNADLFHGSPPADRIKVRGSGSGIELWADVTVRVPHGGRLDLRHGVGSIRADGLEADLELSSQAGLVEVRNSSGEISASTGSGQILLIQSSGDHIELGAGSGNIKIEDCRGDEYEIGAGSGNVTIDGLLAREVEIGTGSGNVRALNLEASNAEIGTGSGEVDVNLIGVSRGDYEIGAGSGNIRLEFVRGADAVVHAETSSGQIELQVSADATYDKQKDDEVQFTLGSGTARVEVGTGSGDIRISG